MFNPAKAFSSFAVKDLQQAKDFYKSKLGIAVSDEPENTLGLHLSDQNVIMIYAKEDHVPATFTVLNFQVENVEKAVKELSEAGIQFEVYTEGELKTESNGVFRGGGPLIAWFKDPSGNFLSVIEMESN